MHRASSLDNVYITQNCSPPLVRFRHTSKSQLSSRCGKTSKRWPEVSPHYEPKGIQYMFHTLQVLSFSSLGNRSWKPRPREQGLVFHGVRQSPKVVDGRVQAAGPPTCLPTPTSGAPSPLPQCEAPRYIPAPADPTNSRVSTSLHQRRGLTCWLRCSPPATRALTSGPTLRPIRSLI